MTRTFYSKMVRDRILKFIEVSGKTCVVETLAEVIEK